MGWLAETFIPKGEGGSRLDLSAVAGCVGLQVARVGTQTGAGAVETPFRYSGLVRAGIAGVAAERGAWAARFGLESPAPGRILPGLVYLRQPCRHLFIAKMPLYAN